jgi:hypothetical protein
MSLLSDLRLDIGDDDGVIPGSGALIVEDLCLTGSLNLNNRVVTASGPVQMTDSDCMVFINKIASEATTVTLPLSPKDGMFVVVKDMKGDADINPITVVVSGGTLDGLSQFIMSNNYQSMMFAYNGTEWNII